MIGERGTYGIRYVILDMAYRPEWLGPDSEWHPTLGWFGGDVPLTLEITDDTEPGEEYSDYPDIATRKFVGLISEARWQRWREAWFIEDDDSVPNLGMITEYGHLPGGRYNFDGMDWNLGGLTPIVFADLSVSGPLDVESGGRS